MQRGALLNRIGLVVATILVTGCVTVETIPLGPSNHPPIAEAQVTLFLNAKEAPVVYEKIALLDTEGDTGQTTRGEHFIKARKAAAAVGANGIIVVDQSDPKMAEMITTMVFSRGWKGGKRRTQMLAIWYDPAQQREAAAKAAASASMNSQQKAVPTKVNLAIKPGFRDIRWDDPVSPEMQSRPCPAVGTSWECFVRPADRLHVGSTPLRSILWISRGGRIAGVMVEIDRVRRLELVTFLRGAWGEPVQDPRGGVAWESANERGGTRCVVPAPGTDLSAPVTMLSAQLSSFDQIFSALFYSGSL